MVKFLPVTDWEVLTLDWVYELWKILKDQRENGVEDSIKTWSLNNKMIVTEDQEQNPSKIWKSRISISP